MNVILAVIGIASIVVCGMACYKLNKNEHPSKNLWVALISFTAFIACASYLLAISLK